MTTAITAERLVEMRAAAHAQVGRFVDPHATALAVSAIRRRGEPWAAAICGRPLDQRSVFYPSLPWLRAPEVPLLAAADTEEDRAQFAELTE